VSITALAAAAVASPSFNAAAAEKALLPLNPSFFYFFP